MTKVLAKKLMKIKLNLIYNKNQPFKNDIVQFFQKTQLFKNGIDNFENLYLM